MTDQTIRSDFLEAMSRVAATVTIVTTAGPNGQFGMTVSAMCSVSADTHQPTLLVCLNQACRTAEPLLANGVFGVNVLHSGQTSLAGIFAGRIEDAGRNRFEFGTWEAGPSGAPLLDEALIAFDCRVLESRLVGSHHVIVGEVGTIRRNGAGKALIYEDRAFHQSGPLEVAQEPRA